VTRSEHRTEWLTVVQGQRWVLLKADGANPHENRLMKGRAEEREECLEGLVQVICLTQDCATQHRLR
jgi:hypothetical protein